MNILMSAFACCPHRGSEDGVGWSWALEAAKLGHQVTVLTQTCDRHLIEQELKSGHVPSNVSFAYFMPGWLETLRQTGMRMAPEGLVWLLTSVFWQICAYFHLRRNGLADGKDIIHHITYAGMRHPTLLGLLGVPLVLGPLGGGERAPFALRRSFHLRAWLLELARDVHTWLLRFDPITRSACRTALVVYAKTEETRSALPVPDRGLVSLHPEIGIEETPARFLPPRSRKGQIRLIFAGRFLQLKGMAIGLKAVAEARRKGIDVCLTMVGSGPEEASWRQLATKLGLSDVVDWRGQVPHQEMKRLYLQHDALLFPSLRDSGGTVVLESMANGRPVICLKLGGPAVIVKDSCGRVVDVENKNEPEVINGLAEAMGELARDPDVLHLLSRGARRRAQQFMWKDIVRDLYTDVERRLKQLRVSKRSSRREPVRAHAG